MVGAIADWFAVTALFKHPLGLPVPHTALIPKRKEMLGRSLQEFVGENFLQEEIIRDRMRVAQLSARVATWLAEEKNAQRVVDEAAAVLHIGLSRIRDEDLVALVEEALLPRFLEEPISPVAGSLLQEIVADKAHHGLVDLALGEAHRWLSNNEETFSDIVGERAPWWSPPSLNERVTHRLHVELVAWIQDIRDDPYHHARTALDALLGPAGPRPAARPGHPGARRAAEDPGAEPSAAGGHRDLAVERLPPRPAGRARRPGGAGAAARPPGADRLRHPAARRTGRSRRSSTATRPTSPSSRSAGTATS